MRLVYALKALNAEKAFNLFQHWVHSCGDIQIIMFMPKRWYGFENCADNMFAYLIAFRIRDQSLTQRCF